ncbi:MAG: hypothetical protein HYY09_02040 [Firmicutes bacterium]|nr:hypothetical protein [Bacillota bacterium]
MSQVARDLGQEELSPEARIKKLAREAGALVVGIASVADINRFAPKGHRPNDMLRGARSVIVTGGKPNTAGAFESPEPRLLTSLRTYPAIRKAIVMKIAAHIEERYGHPSIFYDGGTVWGLVPHMSLKLAAERAGLGTRSLAGGVILNPIHGLLNLSVTITTMPLEADAPLDTPVCPHPACVEIWARERTTPCLSACPECLEGELENGSVKWMRYKAYLCQARARGQGPLGLQKMLYEILQEKDPEQQKLLVFGERFTRLIASASFSSELVAGCYECLRPCPLLAPNRRAGSGAAKTSGV